MSIFSGPDKSHRRLLHFWYTDRVADKKSTEELRAGHCTLRLDPCSFSMDLDEMACQPLPGGVAAAAVGAAMGAALVEKAARMALGHGLVEAGHAEMQALAGQARRHAADLLALADADTQAYRSVLDTRRMAAHEPARQRAWEAAIEVPLRLAELCAPLERSVPMLLESCPSVVRLDLQVGAWLLHTASQAGRLAAEVNLGTCGECGTAESLRLRLAVLKERQCD